MDPVYVPISRCIQPIVIVLGTIGALCNQVLFFSRKQLRSSSCSLYFRALSLNDLLVLLIIILPQWLKTQFGIDPTAKFDWYCKTSSYLTFALYALSPYLIALACFDRLCTSSTNVHLRKLATIRIASYLILSMIIIVFSAFSRVPIWYQLISTSTNSFCTVVDYDSYMNFVQVLLIFSCIIPPSLMLTCCSITLILLRRQRRRVMPVNQIRSRQRDMQLLKMLFIYVTSNIICIVPFSLTCFLQVYDTKNSKVLLNTLTQFFILLVDVNYATSFYLYTLSTPFYRDELFSLIKIIWQRIH